MVVDSVARYFKKIAAFIAALIEVFKRAGSAFFGIIKTDCMEDMAIKVTGTAARWCSYYFIDWGVFSIMGFIVGILRYYSVPSKAIFSILWIIEIAIAGIIVCISNECKIDLTLGEAFRKTLGAIWLESKIVGTLVFVGLIMKLILWDGSERVLIFFRKETPTLIRKAVLLFAVAGIKSYFYMLFFLFGYETLEQLLLLCL